MEPEIKNTESIKALRVQIDACIQVARAHSPQGVVVVEDSYLYRMAQDESIRALTEAKMWAGKMLEGLGNPFPAELADKAGT